MDFGLKEIIITIMIGAFTLLGLEIILFKLFQFKLDGFFRDTLGFGQAKKSSDKSPLPLKLAVFIGLSFGVGIVAEDLSFKFVDNDLPFGLISKYDSRVRSLIGDINAPNVSPLAKELARNGAFEISSDNLADNRRTANWILSDKTTSNPCDEGTPHCYVEDSILELYYHAKNNVYADANYYDEMKRIQARSDFTRSIAIIGVVYFTFTAVAIAVLGLFQKLQAAKQSTMGPAGDGAAEPEPRANDQKQTDNQKPQVDIGLHKTEVDWSLCVPEPKNAGVIMAVLATIIVLSSWAYFNEAREFNMRAFGYFSTKLATEKHFRSKVEGSNTRVEVAGWIHVNSSPAATPLPTK